MAYSIPNRTAVNGTQGTAYSPPARGAVDGLQEQQVGSVALTGLAATTARGTLGIVSDSTIALVGRSATATAGTIPNTALLVGQAATTAAGTVTPADVYVTPTGRSATATAGALGVQIGSDIAVTPAGLSATAGQGALTPIISVGFVATNPLAPTVEYTYAASTTWPGYIRNLFVPVEGYFVGMGEVYDLAGADTRDRAGMYKVSYETRTAWPWDKDGYPPYYSSDTIDINVDWDYYTTYQGGSTFPRGGTFGGVQSDWKYDSALSAPGGFFSVSPDGDVQSTVVRTRVNVLGNFPYLDYGKAHIKSADTYFTWTQGDTQVNGQAYSGPEFRRGVTDAGNDRFTAPLGLYAVGYNRSLLFYAQPHDASVVGVQVRLTGLEATLRGQNGLTPVNVGNGTDSPLTGHRATTGYGTLENFSNSPVNVTLTGRAANARAGTLDGDSGNDYIIPALSALTYVDSNSRWGAEERLVPAARTFAIDKYLTVTHSGYGDVIYVAYLSGTHVAPTTPAYVGVVVMNAVTREVYSHTLTALAAPLNSWRNGWFVANDSNILPHRSVAHVHKLSSGTSLTQFQIGGYVVKLSWTAGTATAPTVTPKTGPVTQVDYSWFIGGWETLEVKGDRIYHVLYEADAYLFNRLRYQYNDVTADDSTWTRHVPATNVSTMGDNVAAYSGFGVPNRKSWLFLELISYGLGGPSNGANRTYWLDWWATEPPLLSVESAGKLGRVTVTIESVDKTVALTGQAATTAAGTIQRAGGNFVTPTGLVATTAQGAFGFISDSTLALTGRSATATAGTLIGGQVAALTGQAATATQGALTPSIVAGAGLQPLTGLRITAAGGYVRFGGAQLEGYRATLQWCVPTVQIDDTTAFTGLGITTAPGTITSEVSTSTLGRSIATARGTLTPGVGVAYWNFIAQAVASAGTLTPSVVNTVQLTGQAATATGGTLAPLSEKSNAATGTAATSAGGVLVPVLVVSLTGARATGNTGEFVPLLAVTPTGRQAVSSQGTLQLLLNIFLTGKAGTCAIGSVGYTYSGGAVLQGAYSKGEVGDVAQGLWKPGREHLLWVFTEPEEPEVEDPPEEEYALVAPQG